MKQTGIKVFKITGIILTSVILFISISTALLLYFYPKDKVKDIIIENTESFLKKKISIESIDYGPGGIELNNVKIFDGLSKDLPLFTKSKRIVLRFSTLSLLHLKFDIDTIKIEGLNLNIIFDENNISNIESFIESLSKNSNTSEKSTISTTLSKLILEKAVINIKNPKEVYAPLKGEYNITSTIKILKDDKLKLYNATVILPENRGVINPDLLINMKKDDFSITGKANYKDLSLLWTYAWTNSPKGIPYNIINGTVNKIKITKDFIEGSPDADVTFLNSKNRAHAKGYFKVDIKNRKVHVKNSAIRIEESTAYVNYILFNFKAALLGFSITNVNMNIPYIRIPVQVLPAGLYGKVTGNLSYKNEKFSGALNLRNVGFSSGEKILTGANFKVNISNNQFKVKNIKVRILKNPCLVSIASTDPSLKKIFVNINSKNFTLPGKLKSSEKNGNTNIPITVMGKINIETLIADDLIFKNSKISYRFSNGKFKIKKVHTVLRKANIFGNGLVNLTSPPSASLSLKFNELKLQEFTSLKKEFKNRLFGVVQGKANLKFLLKGKIGDSLKGKVQFSINRGKIANTGIQNGLGIWLSELKYKLINLEFNRIYGSININKNNYIINSFIFNSELIRLKLKGSINSDLIAKDLKLSLEFTKHFIQDLPSPAITITLRKNLRGNWYIIPFRLNGDISKGKNIKRIK